MIDWNKPIKTRDGRPARVVCRDLKGVYPYIVAILSDNGNGEVPYTTRETGHQYAEGNSSQDVVSTPPPPTKKVSFTGWLNLYPTGSVCVHDSKQTADRIASENRIACLQFSVHGVEGEGL